MPVNQEIKDKICSLYIDGNSIKRINIIVGVSEPTISKILKFNNIEIRYDNGQNLKISKSEVNKLYEDGLSTYAIANKYNCSDETIRKLIDNIRTPQKRNALTEESKRKIGNKSKENWNKETYRLAVDAGKDDEYYNSLKEFGKKNYDRTLGLWISNCDNHKIISEAMKQIWNDNEYRTKQEIYFQERGHRLTIASQDALRDPKKRTEWIEKIRKNNANRENGWVSSSQKQLYYILKESNIDFYEEGPETKVGPFYVVDCIIPMQQDMKRPLIIEVNGEYWHSLPHVALKDRQKATYVNRHTDYDLMTIDELEMNNYQQVEYKLSELGLKLSKIESKVNDIKISKISESEAMMLYSIFHYSSSIRKGAITYGAFVNDNLVAAISYTYPLRRSSAERLKLELKEVMEISRLARKTNFVCKNFASWFISKTIKMLSDNVKVVISFSDHTYGHSGTVYKAANFKEDGIIGSDYSYVSMNGVYHKKTIWDKSKRMKMSESEYADKHNLLKIYGESKTRWVFLR